MIAREERTIEAGFRDISHCVLDRPDDTVHEQLELGWWDCEKRFNAISPSVDKLDKIKQNRTWETAQVDRSQELEESHSVLRVLGEVLVDHIQRRLEYRVQNSRHLRGQQMLKQKSMRDQFV